MSPAAPVEPAPTSPPTPVPPATPAPAREADRDATREISTGSGVVEAGSPQGPRPRLAPPAPLPSPPFRVAGPTSAPLPSLPLTTSPTEVATDAAPAVIPRPAVRLPPPTSAVPRPVEPEARARRLWKRSEREPRGRSARRLARQPWETSRSSPSRWPCWCSPSSSSGAERQPRRTAPASGACCAAFVTHAESPRRRGVGGSREARAS